MLEEVARQFALRFEAQYDLVEPAHMELCEPSIETAYDKLVARGATRIVLIPFFLSFGKHWTRDIPSLLSQAAVKHPGTEYQLVEPLGVDALILDLLNKRAQNTKEPIIQSGEEDPRIKDVEPTVSRVQCTSCPFEIKPDGSIIDKRKQGLGHGV